MYRFKPELRIPGPVPVPSEVSLQMAKPVINHRELCSGEVPGLVQAAGVV